MKIFEFRTQKSYITHASKINKKIGGKMRKNLQISPSAFD